MKFKFKKINGCVDAYRLVLYVGHKKELKRMPTFFECDIEISNMKRRDKRDSLGSSIRLNNKKEKGGKKS